MQLTASRCLDVLNRDASARARARYAEIAKMFAAASAVDAARHDVECQAALRGAPLLAGPERGLAEDVYAEAMRQKLGGSVAVFRDHCAWSDDPRSPAGRRWQIASQLAMQLVRDRLASRGVPAVACDFAAGASFEMEFIHALA